MKHSPQSRNRQPQFQLDPVLAGDTRQQDRGRISGINAAFAELGGKHYRDMLLRLVAVANGSSSVSPSITRQRLLRIGQQRTRCARHGQ